MKRIYNDIPLASILYLVPGNIRLTINDMKYSDIRWNRENAEPVNTWDGMAKESYKMSSRFEYSKVYHIEVPEENHLVFYISTQAEQY